MRVELADVSLNVYVDPAAKKQAKAMLAAYVGQRTKQLSEAREAELAALSTPDAWRGYQEGIRRRLSEYLGDFGPKCPLAAKIVDKIDRPKYVIEKLIFQSQPNYYCTANFYVPKGREFPRPGVLLSCGHLPTGKTFVEHHEACLGLVLKGYVVLALDPMGQGERSEYFDPASGEALVGLTVPQHHYLGRPSWLIGRTLVGYRVWDANRAVELLGVAARSRCRKARRDRQLGGRVLWPC